MKKSTYALTITLLAGSLTLLNPLHANSTNISDAIDAAATQSVLTQIILKEYALTGMTCISDCTSNKTLQNKIHKFDKTLKKLKAFNNTSEVELIISELERAWQPVKQQLKQTPELNKAIKLQQQLDTLLVFSQVMSRQLKKILGQKQSQLMTVSRQKEMLLERIAALDALQAWGLKNKALNNKLQETQAEFSKAEIILGQSELYSQTN